jgi:release factor glutamine methyltransferase
MVTTLSYQLIKKIRTQLLAQFPEEADMLSFIIVEHFSGYTKTEILVDKPFTTGPQIENQIQAIITQLLQNEPIQYILGKAYFYDRSFEVNPATLIPRQETEELVHLVLSELRNLKNLSILDIGTGTGCIPITLALESTSHTFEGVDISKKAIETAQSNAIKLEANVNFNILDILEQKLSQSYDVIISNPPYVLDSEKVLMKENVLAYEPHYALFVLDENPLLFYKRITEIASNSLKPHGKLYFEINKQFGNQIVELLKSHSFQNVNLHQDLNGKDRFVSGALS